MTPQEVKITDGALADMPGNAPVPGARGDKPLAMQQSPDRKVIYTASVEVTVANCQTAHEELGRIIQKHQGYVQNDTLTRVTFRVPPAAFQQALLDLAALGEVTRRDIRSEDVTEAYADLNLRIEVAEGSRKRLMALLERAGKLEDVLKVEQDIRRLTEEIEVLKGKLRFMAHQIDFSTIEVALKPRQDQAVQRRRLDENRFGWMQSIGIDRVLASVPDGARLAGSRLPVRLLLGQQFRLKVDGGAPAPAGFALLQYDARNLTAATAEDFRIAVKTLEDGRESGLKYWGQALREELARNRGYLIESVNPFTLDQAGAQAVRLRCRTVYSGENWTYDVWVVQRESDPQQLLTIEFAATGKADPAVAARVEKAVQGLRWRGTFLGM